MILTRWKFACKNCGYKFQALTNEKMLEETICCINCGSKNFDKKIIEQNVEIKGA
jgi:DNA-directed RNA polymerase subunit RPC12/RpoP